MDPKRSFSSIERLFAHKHKQDIADLDCKGSNKPRSLTPVRKKSALRMKASIAVSDYTPATGIPFGRLGVNRLAPTGVHSPLTARLALFADNHGMSGVLSLPQNRVRRLVARELRAVLAEATGAEPGAFAIAATHTHNAPILVPWRTDDPSFSVLDRLREHVLRLGREAVAGLRPVSLAEGRVRVPGLAGCRRPVYRADDGREQVGTHGPRSGADFLRMESPDEDELRVLFVLDETGTVSGGIVNFACHPTTMYAEPLISADYPGNLCDRLDKHFGCRFLFLTGPAGDQSPEVGGGPDACAAMGRRLADAAIDSLVRAEPSIPGAVRVDRRMLNLSWREVRPPQVDLAQAHLEAVARGERPSSLVPRLYGFAWGFRASRPQTDDWLAREILGLWEMKRRSDVRQITEEAEIQLLTMGSAALLTLPCEAFGAIGQALRARHPGLLIAEQCNGHCGYIPLDPAAFDRGGYECCTAQQSRLVPTAGEEMLNAAEDLLLLRSGGDGRMPRTAQQLGTA